MPARKKMTKKLALEITGHGGGLGDPSKMPGWTTAISASVCKTGAKLAKIPGSTCEKCYAAKGNYIYPSVKKAHSTRLAALEAALSDRAAGRRWVGAMAFLINRECQRIGEPWFRWHDSGDIQSEEHLRLIIRVCLLTPGVKHWLPTREVAMVRNVLKDTPCPANLTIRVSAFMVGARPMRRLPAGTVTSTVSYGKSAGQCPAYTQDGKCLDCRACWSRDVPNVNYPLH